MCVYRVKNRRSPASSDWSNKLSATHPSPSSLGRRSLKIVCNRKLLSDRRIIIITTFDPRHKRNWFSRLAVAFSISRNFHPSCTTNGILFCKFAHSNCSNNSKDTNDLNICEKSASIIIYTDLIGIRRQTRTIFAEFLKIYTWNAHLNAKHKASWTYKRANNEGWCVCVCLFSVKTENKQRRAFIITASGVNNRRGQYARFYRTARINEFVFERVALSLSLSLGAASRRREIRSFFFRRSLRTPEFIKVRGGIYARSVSRRRHNPQRAAASEAYIGR